MADALVERERELAEIGALIDAARSRSGGLLVIDGPAGIGKTRLLEEACRAASAAGMEVLHARGVALEDQFAFGVVRQLFEGVLATASVGERRELLSGAAGLAGALLGFAAVGEASRPAADVSFATLHGLYWLCFNLAARTPLLIAIDDAHWADGPSSRFMSFAAARLAGLRVVLVLALRAGEHGAAAGVLEGIRNDPGARVLRPAELGEHACVRLIKDAFGRAPSEDFARACFEATGGNPFYLRALIDGLRSDRVSPDTQGAELVGRQVPDAVVRSLFLRLIRLPAAAGAVSRALAVLGTDSELRNVVALAELEPSQAARAADLLAGAGILAPGRPLRFRHPIIEGAIYAELPVSERSRMHMNAARLLAETGAATERAASHVFVSEPSGNPWSVGVLRAAAAAALARGAPDSALSYLERAEREGPDADVRAALVAERGSVEFVLGEPAMFDHLREAIVVTSEPGARGRIAQRLANALLFADRAREGVSVLERALDDVGDTDPMLARAIEAELLAMASQHLSTRAVHARHLSRVRALELGDSPSDRLLLANLALWNSTEGERAGAVRGLAERALADGQLLEEVTADSQVFYIAAAALFQCDALQLCRYWLDQALVDARTRGSLIGFALASCWRSEVCYRLGELADAEADARAAIQAAGGDAWVLAPAALAFLAQALLERGELTEADRVLTGSQIPFGRDQPMTSNWLPFARAQLQIARGDLRLAVENLLCCGEWLDAWGVRNPALLDWRTPAAFAFARLGELDRARDLSGELLAQTESLEQPRSHAIALRTAGLVIGGADGIDSLREAVAMIASTPARLEHARTLIDLGAALRRLNHRKDAREPLRQGTELAQRCGATLLAQRGQTELIATGARPRQLAVSGADALTPSERRVAQLAREGLSSPQIAQQLFVTVNTVETHLRHTYQKLSIHSRAELPAALASPSPSHPTTVAAAQQEEAAAGT
jgi:DNA-binding NarL/FixJ family response regulator